MIEATKTKMAEMRLTGMLRAYEALQQTGAHQELTIDEMLSNLVESECSERASRSLTTRISQARLRYPATFEQIKFEGSRKANRTLLLRLGNDEWIQKHENIIITGKTGVGKSFIACALGHRACINERKVMYFSTSKLFAALEQAKADRTHIRLINRLRMQDLIILDDWGIEPIVGESRLRLFEILEDRYGGGSTIIVSQVPVENWHALIKDTTLADAICDRLLHNAHQLKLDGPSGRGSEKEL